MGNSTCATKMQCNMMQFALFDSTARQKTRHQDKAQNQDKAIHNSMPSLQPIATLCTKTRLPFMIARIVAFIFTWSCSLHIGLPGGRSTSSLQLKNSLLSSQASPSIINSIHLSDRHCQQVFFLSNLFCKRYLLQHFQRKSKFSNKFRQHKSFNSTSPFSAFLFCQQAISSAHPQSQHIFVSLLLILAPSVSKSKPVSAKVSLSQGTLQSTCLAIIAPPPAAAAAELAAAKAVVVITVNQAPAAVNTVNPLLVQILVKAPTTANKSCSILLAIQWPPSARSTLPPATVLS